MKGPTQRTLKLLRDQGYRAEVVEKWIPHARKRKDLFDIIDIVAIGDGQTLGVQCTSGSNMSSRVRKIEEADALGDLRDAGWKLLVIGWRKTSKGKWSSRIVDVS